MTRNRIQVLIVGVILFVLTAGDVFATHRFLTEPHPGHNDFMSRWEGARSFWRDSLNPYGDAASHNIQQRIYGRAAHNDEDPGFFAYPFYTLFLIWPLVYTSYAWASAIWMVLLEACLIGSLLLLLDLFRWRPPVWLLALLFLWTLVYYFSARGLLLGQPGLLVYCFEVLTLWALAKGYDRLAGTVLALSTIKPQMGFLLVPFLLLWAWRTRRWNFIGSFALIWGSLMLLSFAMLPSWFGDWIEQLRNYPSYTALGAPVWIIMDYYLGLGAVGEWVINGLLYGLLLWAWYHVLLQGEQARLDWTIMLTLTITHLAAVRTATPHYVIFTIPMLFYFRMLPRRSAATYLIISLTLLLLLVIPWLHFFTTVEGEFEHPTLYLPLPIIMLALLWFTRRWWWAAPSCVFAPQPGK